MPSIRTGFHALLAAACAMLGLAAAARAEAIGSPSGAIQVVEKLHATLLAVMKDAEKLGYQGRYEKLAPVLNETYDTPFMAEKSVGRHWNQATPEERAELVATFSRFMVANYAGRFDGYSGQSFQTLGEEPSAQGTVLVRTRLLDPNDESVQLNYRLRQDGGTWKIIDVYLNGTVSELALRRSEYAALIQREGWNAVIAALDQRIQGFATSPADHKL